MAEDLRLVVVDDDPDFRLLLTALLDRATGVDVVGDAADGHEALEVIAATDPDAAVIDLLMPGMDGFELIQLLREQRPTLRIVANSALAGGTRAERLGELGVEVLLKSSDTTALVAALGRATAG